MNKPNRFLKTKSMISLFVAFSFGIIAITGVLMYVLQHSKSTALLHTVFGFLFLLIAFLHLRNNWKAISSYSKGSGQSRAKPEFYASVGVVGIILTGSLMHWQPFSSIYDWGAGFRTGQKQEQEETITYVRRKMNLEGKGQQLAIDFRKGPYFKWPTYAVWLEDTTGKYLQTLYVTEKLAKNNFYVKVETDEHGQDKLVADPTTKADRERPEALPVWSHRYGNTSGKGNRVPSGEQIVPDGYTGATMLNNFYLESRVDSALPDHFVVKFEINHSFDWNEHYSKDAFPDDPVYSGSGKPGQPSLIYAAHVDLKNRQKLYALELIGRGHHSGGDGHIYTDLTGITTAKELIDRIILEIL